MDKNIKLVESFFKIDLKIKQILRNLAPQDIDRNYNYSYAILQYEEKLYKGLKELREEFSIIIDIFNNLEVRDCYNNLEKIVCIDQDICDKLFNDYFNLLINCTGDYDKLVNFYRRYLISMSNEIIDKTKRNCIGYYLGSDPSSVIKECVSLNEMLHVFHFALVNNEGLYVVMPRLDLKVYDSGEIISLYGRDNDMARDIFNSFSKDSDNGATDILSLNDKILIMVRDRGHALSLEIVSEKDGVYVKYFIPKICNIEMVNNLRGVTKVKNDDIWAVGEFKTDYDKVGKYVVDFIEMVPTDMDMDFSFISDIGKVL